MPFYRPQRGRKTAAAHRLATVPAAGRPIGSCDPAYRPPVSTGDQSIGIHSNDIHTYPLEWTASWNALVSNALKSIAYQCNSSPTPTSSRHPPGENDKRDRGWFHYNSGKATNHPEVKTMPKCAFCGAELEPPVRVPHTVYVKKLYRVAG